MRCVYPRCHQPRALDDMCLLHIPRDTSGSWRSDAPFPQVVSALEEAGYRPTPMRTLQDHVAWGAPDVMTAACPLCSPGMDTMRVEEWDGGTIVYCSAHEVCPSHKGASSEKHVHNFVWTALLIRVPQLWDIEGKAAAKPKHNYVVDITPRISPMRGYRWRSR